jgi:hypothetical protein
MLVNYLRRYLLHNDSLILDALSQRPRSEAIRRLVEIGLSESEPSKRPKVLSTAKQSAARAAELAAKTIDNHIDPKAPPEEREVRKRKLIQGPSVFRDARKDRPGK